MLPRRLGRPPVERSDNVVGSLGPQQASGNNELSQQTPGRTAVRAIGTLSALVRNESE
jgi:hypothetical protein